LAILYYHHRTPELIQKDVKGLSRLPEHLSVILKLEDGGRGGAGLEALVDEVAEIAAWCACAGIPTLSVYEQTGTLRYSYTVGQVLIYRRNSQGICPSDT
jgi:dehydrodolichyl diphosphate syntase complex subunit NUS1